MKRIKQLLLSYTFGVCLLFFAHPKETIAQNATNALNNKIEPLRIGDQVPDIVFEKMLNYKSKKAKLSDFKGKLVILDMWSTVCSSCIAAFPKMEKLQKEFNDQIQILLVNPYNSKYDSEEMVRRTLEKNKNRTGFYPSLPIPIHDTLLNSYFTHKSVPHLVWIDKDAKVIAITGSSDFTIDNVRKILENRSLDVAIKNDWGYDKTTPLLVNGNGGNSKYFMFRSMFTGYIGGIGYSSSDRRNANGEVIGIYTLNKSIRHLVSSAYHELIGGFNGNRIFLNVNNPAQFKLEFDTAYAYCYDLTFPPANRDSLDVSKFLREDLKRYFNVSAHRERRRLPCLVITIANKLGSIAKNEFPELDLDKNSIKKFIHNYSIEEVFKILDAFFHKPLINETGVSEKKIDLDFPDRFDLSDEKAVIEVLRKAGFEITEEEREMEVVVITDK